MQAIGASPKPVIARVRGAAVAAGCQLVASCDLAFAADTARFAVSGVNLGLFCSTPASPSAGRRAQGCAGDAADRPLRRRGRGRGHGPDQPRPARRRPRRRGEAAASAIAAKPPEAIALGKAVFNRQMALPPEDAYAVASRAMAENLAYDSARSGIDGFLKR